MNSIVQLRALDQRRAEFASAQVPVRLEKVRIELVLGTAVNLDGHLRTGQSFPPWGNRMPNSLLWHCRSAPMPDHLGRTALRQPFPGRSKSDCVCAVGASDHAGQAVRGKCAIVLVPLILRCCAPCLLLNWARSSPIGCMQSIIL